jgi:hypothetical protein
MAEFAPQNPAASQASSAQLVRAPVTSFTKANLTVNPEGKAWVLYRDPLPAVYEWAEYDPQEQTILFVAADGMSQSLGLEIPPSIDAYLHKATEIHLVRMEGTLAVDLHVLPLLIRAGNE